ncbi:PorT family protein [Flavobacterium zhairuonense]|uniref:porin family protein n=1 Tax=Flavobacterium zhairuonense TaxID=2493631 RepID=UPI00104E93A5|nr:porin family protein [Flavobacterium zhairuonense]KAF2506931.1 PorT family protein [Flavobacterium zhairuonense]
MKKSMLLLCTLFACAAVTAQTEKVKLGAKAGLNISNLTFDENAVNSSSRTGFTAGLMAEIPLAKSFSVQPEFLYSQQGMKFSYADADVQNSHYKSTVSLNYINIPIMLKYYVVKGLSLQAGPQVGILLKAKNEYQDNFLGYENYENLNLKDYSNGVDASVNFGLGYQFKDRFYADARYNMSYTDVFKDATSNTNYIINSNMKNRVFQVTFGYFFN